MSTGASFQVGSTHPGKVRWGVWAALTLPVLIYLPALMGGIPYPPGESEFTDLLIAHYPSTLYLKQALSVNHQIPLWFSTIFAGSPFAANPLSGLFYLPGWLAMVFPLPLGILLTAAGHSVFGAGGMYLLLRRIDLQERSCLVGALCFGVMPKLAAHFGAGHISLLYAIAWTPWLLAVSLKDSKGWRTGITAGLLFLADPRWSVYAGLLLVIFDVAYRKGFKLSRAIFFLRAGIIAFLIAAPLLLPLFEYLPLSTRSAMEAGDILEFGLPAGQLIGLVIPASGGNVEWYLYAGGSVLALFGVQFFVPELWKKNRIWNAAFLVSLLLAAAFWGRALPWIADIPGISLLRVPARSLFLAGFSLAVVVGMTLDHLLGQGVAAGSLRRAGYSGFMLAVLLGSGVALVHGKLDLRVMWGFGALALASAVLFGISWANRKRRILLLTVLVLIDLVGAGWMAYQVRGEIARADTQILDYLRQDGSEFRVYSPSYSIAQGEAVENSLELVDGVDPMQLSTYASYLERATGVARSGYSVSIPEFEKGDPDSDNAGSQPDAEMLGKLNVKYLVSEFPLATEGIMPVEIGSSQYLYQNTALYPRAWVESGKHDAEIKEATIITKEPNRIEIEAAGPGDLILSEVFYPGWKAFVDGQEMEISPAYQVLRQIPLPEGIHRVAFIFRPGSLYAGLALAGCGWLLFVFTEVRKRS